MFFVAALFFAGILMGALRMVRDEQSTLLIMSAVFLTYGIIHIATLPVLERDDIALASDVPRSCGSQDFHTG